MSDEPGLTEADIITLADIQKESQSIDSSPAQRLFSYYSTRIGLDISGSVEETFGARKAFIEEAENILDKAREKGDPINQRVLISDLASTYYLFFGGGIKVSKDLLVTRMVKIMNRKIFIEKQVNL
jgi:hypothetical protein